MTGDTLKLTKAQTDKLIDHVRDREVLYNLTHKDYHKDDIKRNNWIEIAEKMGIDDGAAGLKAAWKNLNDTLVRKKKGLPSGSGADAAKKHSNWCWWENMLWLIPYRSRGGGNVSSIQRTSSLNTPSSDSQQQSTSGIQHDSASDSQSIALPDSADIDLVTDSLPESPARPRSAYSEAESDDSLFTRPPTPSTPLNTALISQRPGTSAEKRPFSIAKATPKKRKLSESGPDAFELTLLNKIEEIANKQQQAQQQQANDAHAAFGREIAGQLNEIGDKFEIEVVKRQIRDFLFEARFRNKASAIVTATRQRPPLHPLTNSQSQQHPFQSLSNAQNQNSVFQSLDNSQNQQPNQMYSDSAAGHSGYLSMLYGT